MKAFESVERFACGLAGGWARAHDGGVYFSPSGSWSVTASKAPQAHRVICQQHTHARTSHNVMSQLGLGIARDLNTILLGYFGAETIGTVIL